jgi:hypothetical protein
LKAGKSGSDVATLLFNKVQDGDIVHVKNVLHYINANLIFEWSGKHVYVPTDFDHSWYPEVPSKSAKTFELSRLATAERDFQLVEIQDPSKPNKK